MTAQTSTDAAFTPPTVDPRRRRFWQPRQPIDTKPLAQALGNTRRAGGGLGKLFGIVAAIVAGLFCLFAGPIGWIAAIFLVPLAYMIGRAIPMMLVGLVILYAYHALFGLPTPPAKPAPAPSTISAPAPASTAHPLPKVRAPLSR